MSPNDSFRSTEQRERIVLSPSPGRAPIAHEARQADGFRRVSGQGLSCLLRFGWASGLARERTLFMLTHFLSLTRANNFCRSALASCAGTRLRRRRSCFPRCGANGAMFLSNARSSSAARWSTSSRARLGSSSRSTGIARVELRQTPLERGSSCALDTAALRIPAIFGRARPRGCPRACAPSAASLATAGWLPAPPERTLPGAGFLQFGSVFKERKRGASSVNDSNISLLQAHKESTELLLKRARLEHRFLGAE